MDFKNSRKRIIKTILAFLIITLCVLALLINQNYKSLKKETFYNLKNQTDESQSIFENKINKFFLTEQARSVSDYSFFNAAKNDLTDLIGVTYSPLADINDDKYKNGIIGYFQIDSDASFSSPILPASDQDTIKNQGKILTENELNIRTRKVELLQSALLESLDLPDLKSLYEKLNQYESEKLTVVNTSIRSLTLIRKTKFQNQNIIQGIILDPKVFFEEIIKQDYAANTYLNNVRITITESNRLAGGIYNHTRLGEETKPIEWLNNFKSEIKIANYTLDRPFDTINFTYSTAHLPYDQNLASAARLYFITAIFVIGGYYFLYRIFLNQLKLTEERTNFVSAVSHELKTPLTSIRMYSEMLLNGWVKDEEKKTEHIKYIFKESERLSRLINNVLDYAKLSNQSPMLPLETLEVDEVVKEIEEHNSDKIKESGFSLRITNEGAGNKDLTLDVNKDAIIQIFINLIDNAIKFSSAGSEKILETGYRVSANEKNLILYLRDYGNGIPKDQMERIFDLFYRPENELTRTTPGTGIGLALVKELAAKIGAEIKVRNCSPGAEFSLIFQTTSNH